MQSTNQLYIRGIDHMRGLAALMVVFFHSIRGGNVISQAYVPENPLLSIFEEGHTGVALFITITGFIFTTIIGDKQIIYTRFLFNRFIRIFPLLFVLSLFASLVISGVDNGNPLAMLEFFNLFGGGVYWGTWTLVVEFQFYLFFPIFFVYFRDHFHGPFRKYLPFLGMVILGFAFRLMFFIAKGNAQDIGYWTIFGRIDQFMCGVMACLLVKDFQHSRFMQSRWAGLGIFLAAFVVLMFTYHYFNSLGLFLRNPSSPSPWWLIEPTVEGVIYSSMLLGWVLFTRHLMGPGARAAAYVGAISYSTYLLHFAVVDFCVAVTDTLGLAFSADPFTHRMLLTLLVVYPLTLMLSVVSYELIEKPFFRRRVNYIRD